MSDLLEVLYPEVHTIFSVILLTFVAIKIRLSNFNCVINPSENGLGSTFTPTLAIASPSNQR